MPEDAYWEHIEQYFVKKRGNALILSPKDWPLLRSWQERKIPLDVIYEGIDRAFERLETKQPMHQRWTVRSLAFCQREVEAAWSDWTNQHAQENNQEMQTALDANRQKLAAKVQSTITQLQKYATQQAYRNVASTLLSVIDVLQSFLPGILEAEEEATLLSVREQIRAQEKELFSRFEQTLSAEIRAELYEKAEARLILHKGKMKPDIYRETLQLAFLQELRTAYPLPSFF